MRITVCGLWHLGCVTAACLAEAGHRVVGLDPDPAVVAALRAGRPPLFEPGLAELVAAGLAAGRLSFSSDPRDGLLDAELLWVAFDTPVDARDEADVASVRARLEAVREAVPPETMVVVSSQVPVGFTRGLAREWSGRRLRFACAPENLRLGQALESFRRPERVVVGLADESDRPLLTALFEPFCPRIEWMSVESAEMTKHALNAFLGASVGFANELARLCEAVGADAKEVERGLKTEGRIGRRAYLSPGPAFAGGTLARDLRFLSGFGRRHGVATPLLDGVLASNEIHRHWLHEKVRGLLKGLAEPVAAVLGLSYKPGTSTLRRSASVELCSWLGEQGVKVQAHDPGISELPADLRSSFDLRATPQAALEGADVAIVATAWPEYGRLAAEDFVGAMRHPRVVDETWFLSGAIAGDPRIVYVAPGRPARG
jgi:UDPglucose 6-dehydrogenase